MRGVLTGLLVVVLSLTASAQDAARLLKTAINTEIVDGDLKRAIEQYRQVAASGDKRLAADALVRMAGCYEKLGNAEAQEIYRRILREYADQPEAVAIAKRRVGAVGTGSTARGDRPVWTGETVDMFGQVSPDGRFISYVDWSRTMNLMLRDVQAGTDRALTDLPSFVSNPGFVFQGQAEFSTISKDQKQIAYTWIGKTARPYELRVTALDTQTAGTPKTLFNAPEDVTGFSPFDWSPDGRSITVAIQRTDGTAQIGLVSTGDGGLRILKSVTWRGPERIFFSPDSRYIAYDLPSDEPSGQRDIFIMDVNATREVAAVVHSSNDRLMGWSPDGTKVLFTSDRNGPVGLWSVGFAGGVVEATPRLVRDGVRGLSLGMTRSGALYIYKGISDRDVKVAQIDLASGKLVGAITGFDQGFVEGPGGPDWSRDGTRLAYQACNGNCVAIRTVATGQVRQFHGLYAQNPRWSPDGRSLIVAGRDIRGRNGIFRMDAENGAVTSVVLGPGQASTPQWSLDGGKILHRRGANSIVERDLTTGVERQVAQYPLLGPFEVSPDGRQLVSRTRMDRATKKRQLVLFPTDGGASRVLLEVSGEENFFEERTFAWTPDGRSVLVVKRTPSGPQLWQVPVSGEAPRKLEIDVESWQTSLGGGFGFTLSPDGKRIAFLMGRSAAEVWAVEHLVR